MRFEIPAVLVVDQDDPSDALLHATKFARMIDMESGPGAFFPDLGVVVTDFPRGCDETREDETVVEHCESLRAAAALGS